LTTEVKEVRAIILGVVKKNYVFDLKDIYI